MQSGADALSTSAHKALYYARGHRFDYLLGLIPFVRIPERRCAGEFYVCYLFGNGPQIGVVPNAHPVDFVGDDFLDLMKELGARGRIYGLGLFLEQGIEVFITKELPVVSRRI